MGFNTDNQATQTVLDNGTTANITYNGNGDPLSVPFLSSNYAATYDPEDRLTYAVQNILDARYDGDSLRAWNGGIYYLYDGETLVAEVDNSIQIPGQIDLLALNMFGATGQELRWRGDDTLPSSPGTAYTYDPQGSLVQPVTLSPTRVLRARTSSSYDGFGGYSIHTADAADGFDPVGFGGQYGYYNEYTGLYLLTHRY